MTKRPTIVFFLGPRNLSHHIDRQARTGDTVLVKSRAGIFKQSMEARNRGGIGLSYRTARLHRLAESIPWNQFFLGFIKV
jgi:hypothetical protein